MQGDLISYINAGHLRNPNELCFSENDIVEMIKNQPTAYDVENVLVELEEKSDDIPVQYENNYEQGYTDGIYYAIDIVRKWWKGVDMEIVEKTNLVEVSTLHKGTVFRYKKEYYIVSDGYRGDMHLKNRLYINLRTGHGDVFMNVKVEPIENIKMVIGGKK